MAIPNLDDDLNAMFGGDTRIGPSRGDPLLQVRSMEHGLTLRIPLRDKNGILTGDHRVIEAEDQNQYDELVAFMGTGAEVRGGIENKGFVDFKDSDLSTFGKRARQMAELLDPEKGEDVADQALRLGFNPIELRRQLTLAGNSTEGNDVNERARVERLVQMIPGTEWEMRGPVGDKRAYVRLPGHEDTPMVPIDRANSMITALWNAGDWGDIYGHVATWENAAITAAGFMVGGPAAPAALGAVAGKVGGKIPAMIKNSMSSIRPSILTWQGRTFDSMVYGTRRIARGGVISVALGGAGAAGRALDMTLEEIEGYSNGNDVDRIARETLYTFGTLSSLEGGARAMLGFMGLSGGMLYRLANRKGRALQKEVLATAHRRGIPLFAAELGQFSKAILEQTAALSGSISARITRRDLLISESFQHLINTVGDAKGLTTGQLRDALGLMRGTIAKGMADTGARVGGSIESQKLFAEFISYEKQNAINHSRVAQELYPDTGFDASVLSEVSRRAKGVGIRRDIKGTTTDAAGRRQGAKPTAERPNAQGLLRDNEGWAVAGEPLDPRVADQIESWDRFSSDLRSVPTDPSLAGTTTSTAVDQLANLRREAHALTDLHDLNQNSKTAAQMMYQSTVDIMENATGPPAFRTAMRDLSDEMAWIERWTTDLEVRRLADIARDIDPVAFGAEVFNLAKPRMVGQLKKFIQEQPNGEHNWRLMKDGYIEKFFNNPAGAVKTMAVPEHQDALNVLFSKNERQLLLDTAQELDAWTRGKMYGIVKHSLNNDQPVARQIMQTRDLPQLEILIKRWGGPSSPESKSMASAMLQIVYDHNTKLIGGVRKLNKKAMARDIEILNREGYLKALLGEGSEHLQDVNGMAAVMDAVLGDPGMGTNLLKATMASQARQGVADPSRAYGVVSKLIGSMIMGRLLISPTVTRLAALRPAGPSITPDSSFWRTYIELISEARKQTEDEFDVGPSHAANIAAGIAFGPANLVIDLIDKIAPFERTALQAEMQDAQDEIDQVRLREAQQQALQAQEQRRQAALQTADQAQ